MPAVLTILLLSSAACWLMATAPSTMFVVTIVWGMCLVLGGYYLDRMKLLLLFIANIAVIYAFSANTAVFTAVALFGIPSLLMGILLGKRRGYYELQKWGMIAAVVTVGFFLTAAYLSLGEPGVKTLNQQVETYIQDSIKISQDSGLIDFYEQRGVQAEEIEESVTQIMHSFVRYLPAFYFIQSMMTVFLTLLCCAYIATKRKMGVLSKKPFQEEIMPWQFVWVVIAGLALWLWGRSDLSIVYYIGANILAISIPVTVYYGSADLAYRVARFKEKNRKWVIAGLILLTLVFPLSAIIFIGLIGLFDSLLDYRKLRKKEE